VLSDRWGIVSTVCIFERGDWGAQIQVILALSSANSCHYGFCHAAILIAGYSAAIGFIHTGYSLAFVHDVADLYKMELAAPTAFRIVAEGAKDVEMKVRHALRDAFRRVKLLERLIPGIETLLDAGEGLHGAPPELAGCRLEVSRPEDAPWQQGDLLPDARAVAREIHGDEPPQPPQRKSAFDLNADDGLPF